jgi:hypothetical protein
MLMLEPRSAENFVPDQINAMLPPFLKTTRPNPFLW